MEDQADTAVDPFEQAVALIANSEEESDDLDNEDQENAPEGDEDESSDAEEASATDAPKREVQFAGQKFEIPDGTPEEVAVKVEEIGKNLQADYTRKTQDLVSRERQAAEVVQRELDTGRQHIQQAMQQAQALIQVTGGFMDPTEMARLAQENPQAWIAQNARQQQLQAYFGQLNQQAQVLEQQAKQAREQAESASKQAALQKLEAEGVNHEALTKLWGDAKTHFGLTDERLSQVLDAESWLVLRDAVAFRQLKAQKPAVTKQAAAAPKLPEAPKRPMSKDDRARLDARKAVQRRGGAGLRDLAAFIETNKR